MTCGCKPSWRAAGAAMLIFALVAATPVLAQQAQATQQVFPAAFFAQFQPSTALQMVERVPGFVIVDPVEEAAGDIRGFSQAAGNIVINGQRPSSKSDTLRTVLSRIPATRVARIEVAAGNVFGADYIGRAQVVNVVLTKAGGAGGAINAAVYRRYDGLLRPEGSVTGLIRRGASTFNLLVGVANDDTGEIGGDTIRSLPSRQLVEYRRKVNTLRNPNYYASAGWAYDGGVDRVAHLNGRYSLMDNSLVQDNDIYPAVGPVRYELLGQYSERRSLELGGDVTRPLLGGGLELIGLATRRERRNHDDLLPREVPATRNGSTQLLHDQRDETLGRLVWRNKDVGGWAVELGVEGVVNRLDSQVDLFNVLASGVRIRTDLPVDHAVVEERRGGVSPTWGAP